MKPTNIKDPSYFHKVVDCQWACPAHTPVPEYIRLIAQGRYDDAYMINWYSNVFPGVLGRTCDRPCEPACRRGRVEDGQSKEPVAICRLKRVAADNKNDIRARLPKPAKQKNGKRIALIGAVRHGMRVEIRALQQRLAMTVVYVTHDQVEAMSMADRVILMREGRIEQEGTPEELYARPGTVFAARFIGTPAMNLVALADGPRGAVIRGAPDAPVLPGRGAGRVFGVRPEHVELVAQGGVPGRVTSAEYHGADSILTVQVGEESLLARAPGRVGLAPGAAVRLGWQAGAVHVFDAGSGTRLDLGQAAAQPA